MLHLGVTLNCNKCEFHCCSTAKRIRPVLMPWEPPEQFFGLTERKGKLHFIKIRECGSCIFFDRSLHQCGVYDRRPLACQLYPFVLKVNRNFTLQLDKRCPQCDLFTTLSSKRLMEGLVGYKFPAAWVRAYKAIQD